MADKVRVVRAAISEREGQVAIAYDPNHTGGATLREGTGNPEEMTIKLVAIEQVDEIVPDFLPIYMKIDVEGHEEVVLQQLTRSRHAERIQFIFVEIDEDWVNAASVRAMLGQIGLTRIEKVGGGKHYDIAAYRN